MSRSGLFLATDVADAEEAALARLDGYGPESRVAALQRLVRMLQKRLEAARADLRAIEPPDLEQVG